MVLLTGASSFSEAMRWGSETYHHLAKLIKAKYGRDATPVGDEGGFAPNFQNNAEAIDLLVGAIEKAGYTGKMKIGMDVAASEFRKGKLSSYHRKALPYWKRSFMILYFWCFLLRVFSRREIRSGLQEPRLEGKRLDHL